MRAAQTIIALNSGSSSLKFALYSFFNNKESLIAKGAVEQIGLNAGRFWLNVKDSDLPTTIDDKYPDHKFAVKTVFDYIKQLGLPLATAVGHRIVHGGADYSAPAIVDAKLLQELHRLVPFAPLHMPGEIAGIEAIADNFPNLPQVACFDTAFHRDMPELARRLPLDRALWDEGVRRYGFHGLSYEYILSVLGDNPPKRTIIAHLGNGVSLAALRDGRPLDTTMGFTPTGGTMMGTRSGDLDPGILLYLMREKAYDEGRIDELVNRRSGLLGVSDISMDMKTLLEKSKYVPEADQAVKMFCYYLRKYIGALSAVLGGLDALIFTGGIGERAAPVRENVCRDLGYLGIELDLKKNKISADTISMPRSSCIVRVIPTNEDLIIARHTIDIIMR